MRPLSASLVCVGLGLFPVCGLGAEPRANIVLIVADEMGIPSYGLPWANAWNTPFRLYKHWVHEGGIATTLIAHWPKGIARAGELDRSPGT